MTSSSPEPSSAGLFHAGNTCPFCQETIAAGQLITTCPGCGSLHHESCWRLKNGCSSYHCDRTVRMETPDRPADFVLSSDDVARAEPTLAPRRVGGLKVAETFLPPPPLRRSRLAFCALAFALLSFGGIAGALKGNIPIVLLGSILAFMGIFFGVISLVRINNPGNRLSGMPIAAGAVFLPVALVIIYFSVLNTQLSRNQRQVRMNLQMHESLPTEERLDRMTPAIANAMRANVVVRHSGGFGGQSYGSGVVLRVNDRRAAILTNKHVIGNTKDGTIQVIYYTGEESKADVEWLAPDGVDLAVLNSPVLTLQKHVPQFMVEQPVVTGARVFAIGNPMGLSWTYTEGTISGLRRISGGPHGVELYQTQTPINSGNSGGGLYTDDGRLTGINTLTEDKQVAEGLSFAISVTIFLQLISSEQKARWVTTTVERTTP